MTRLILLATALAAAIATLGSATAGETGEQAAHRLRRSINLGNALEAPSEGAWGVTIKEEYFDLAKKAGFTGVRIPVCWSAHTQLSAPYTIDADFMARVDEVVAQAQRRGLAVVINVHHFNEMNANPESHLEELKSLWTQIAKHFVDHRDGLYFELFNEPNGNFDASWKDTYPQLIEVVRSVSPERVIIVGPSFWNDFHRLNELAPLAGDEHVIATFHYYLPFAFTHQGAPWVPQEFRPPVGTTWGTEAEHQAIHADLEEAAAWAKENRLPLFIGEFGVYRKADMDSRIRWTETVVDEAKKHGMSWAYWEMVAEQFGAYDQRTGQWRKGLLNALIKQPAGDK